MSVPKAGPMSGFRKRTFSGPLVFLRDLSYLILRLPALMRVLRKGALAPAFRERLCLAVTRVNQCRYCTRAHTRMALAGGIPREEIETIMHGEFGHCPPEELTAMLYAVHWAETDGHPDAPARTRLLEAYPAALVREMDLVLHMIRMGNYTGNAVDAVLYKISFGRWGFD